MQTQAQLQARRDELTEQINSCETWEQTAGLRHERNLIDAKLNPTCERNSRARARRKLNPQPNGGKTGRWRQGR